MRFVYEARACSVYMHDDKTFPATEATLSLKDIASGQSCGRVLISLVSDVSRSREKRYSHDYYSFDSNTFLIKSQYNVDYRYLSDYNDNSKKSINLAKIAIS